MIEPASVSLVEERTFAPCICDKLIFRRFSDFDRRETEFRVRDEAEAGFILNRAVLPCPNHHTIDFKSVNRRLF